jgi:hypothetical protein
MGREAPTAFHEPRQSKDWQLWGTFEGAVWFFSKSQIASLEERRKTTWGYGVGCDWKPSWELGMP